MTLPELRGQGTDGQCWWPESLSLGWTQVSNYPNLRGEGCRHSRSRARAAPRMGRRKPPSQRGGQVFMWPWQSHTVALITVSCSLLPWSDRERCTLYVSCFRNFFRDKATASPGADRQLLTPGGHEWWDPSPLWWRFEGPDCTWATGSNVFKAHSCRALQTDTWSKPNSPLREGLFG